MYCCRTRPPSRHSHTQESRSVSCLSSLEETSVELTADVEAQVDRVAVASPRDLTWRRIEVVAEIELQYVPMRRLLDADVPGGAIRAVAGDARRRFGDHVRGFEQPKPRAQP